MAATFVTVAGIQASASSGRRRPNPDRGSSSTATWWTPIFGWSSEPDYIDSNNKVTSSQITPESDSAADKSSRPRFAGGFTEEKAKQLRLMTVGTKSFHDTMYHSAIASRLASDFNDGTDL